MPLNRAMNFMNDRAFVDTNILVYAHDSATGHKHLKANQLVRQLWKSGTAVLSTQVLQELCVNLQRKCAKVPSNEEIRSILKDYSGWLVVTHSAVSIIEAFEMQLRWKLSFWDALILQAAESAGCDVVFSEDFEPNRRFGNLRIVNPLL
jgi:predicted nucleic acid-binding protein